MARRPGTAAGLNAELLARAVLEVADGQGLEALSVRNVARHVGVEAMSIYHWFPTKDALLAAAWDEVVSQLDPGAMAPGTDAAHYAEDFAVMLRGLLLQHPNALPVMLGRHARSSRAMTVIDGFVAGLVARGCTPAQGVELVNMVSMFTMASVLNDHLLTQDTDRPDPDPQVHPALAAAVAEGLPWGAQSAEQRFLRGVRGLINSCLAEV